MLLVPGIVGMEGFKVPLGGRLDFLRVVIRGLRSRLTYSVEALGERIARAHGLCENDTVSG